MTPHVELRKLIEESGGLHTVADLARRWGVSKARVYEMSQRPDFPEPLFRMGRSAVYVGNEADDWRAEHRPVGRPPRKET